MLAEQEELTGILKILCPVLNLGCAASFIVHLSLNLVLLRLGPGATEAGGHRARVLLVAS